MESWDGMTKNVSFVYNVSPFFLEIYKRVHWRSLSVALSKHLTNYGPLSGCLYYNLIRPSVAYARIRDAMNLENRHGYSVNRLIIIWHDSWLIDRLRACLIDWLIDWLIDLFIYCLLHWFIDLLICDQPYSNYILVRIY